METRKVLLRIMLGALAVAAIGGAVSIVLAEGETIWRIIATAMATAACCAILFPLSLLSDRPATRWSGLLSMGVIVCEFALALALIWEVPDWFGSWRAEERIALTMLFLFLVGIPASLCLQMWMAPYAAVAGLTGVVLCAVELAILMFAVWISHGFLDEQELFKTAGALAAMGPLAIACLVGVGRPPSRWWRWVGVGGATVAFAMLLVGIWIYSSEKYFVFTVFCCLGVTVAVANLAMLATLKAGQRWVLIATIAAAITAALFMAAAAGSWDLKLRNWDEILLRLSGAGAIVSACAGMALIILSRLNRKVPQPLVRTDLKEITVHCPACNSKQTVALGEGKCGKCGLIIRVEVEEPRCPECNYLLYMLESDRCPECGTIVRPSTPSIP